MQITMDMIRELREKTGAGILDCRNALTETNADLVAACAILERKGLAAAAKKADRVTAQGVVESYIHGGGRIGALIEVNCETDFVAKTNEFRELVHELAMQVTATNPEFVDAASVPDDVAAKEKALYQGEAAGKSADIAERIIAGKYDKWLAQVCLMNQPYIRDQDKTIGQLVTEHIAKLGENIRVRRFARFELGN